MIQDDIQRIRDSVPLPATIGELYLNGKLRNEYLQHGPVDRVIQRLHRRAGEAVEDKDSLPPGLQQAIKLPLIWVQIVNRHPWKIMWVRTDEKGRKRKGEKLCTTLGGAILEWRRIKRLAPNATVISRARGYDIPPSLRGRLPKGWVWCPHCMKPRKYKRGETEQKFSVLKKQWSEEKGRYEWRERMVYLLICPLCGNTNRDQVYRRSNQPWEIRKFKKGVRRARPRHRTTKRKRGRRS